MKDDHLFIEEQEHKKNKKASRQERKRLTEKDRSKYKKTDFEKIKTPISKKGQKGRVLQIGPAHILCMIDHTATLCTLKGALKKEKRLSKNIIACGDEVIIDTEDSSPTIVQILPRKTILSRADNLSRKKEQIIASNIDQVFITASILEPVFKSSLIDRYLIAAYKGGLNPIILITKMDLIEKQQDFAKEQSLSDIDYIQKLAKALDIPLILFSKTTHLGLDLLKKHLKDKTSVFSGQSGVGKSSIINLITEAHQQIQPVVSKTAKGSHTTTQAVMLPLKDSDGYCIDTPGIRSFGLWEIDQNDIKKYFKEIDEAGQLCKYPDCSHLNEPDCNVQILLEEGKIDPLRFNSYAGLMQEAKNQHLKR